MQFATPADWEIALVSGPSQDAHCVFMDRSATRLDVRWRHVATEPNLELMLAEHMKALDAKDVDIRRLSTRSDAWHAIERTGERERVVHAGKYFPFAGWLAEVCLTWPDGRDEALETAILAGIGPDQETGRTVHWKAMGLDARVPRDLGWPDCKATVGRVCWDFTRGKGASTENVSLERLAMPDYWLSGQIADWLVRELPAGSTVLEKKQIFVGGHKAELVTSRHMAQRRGYLPAGRRRHRTDIAWVCPVENRFYRLSHTVSARSRVESIITQPHEVAVTCCNVPPLVVEPSHQRPHQPVAASPASTKKGPGSVDALLAGMPLVNRAADITRSDDGTACVRVPIRRPRYLVPPLSWVLPFSSHRNIRLDRLGTHVLDLCAKHRSLEALITQFARDHKLSYREAQLSTTPFLRSLTERGVLVVAGA